MCIFAHAFLCEMPTLLPIPAPLSLPVCLSVSYTRTHTYTHCHTHFCVILLICKSHDQVSHPPRSLPLNPSPDGLKPSSMPHRLVCGNNFLPIIMIIVSYCLPNSCDRILKEFVEVSQNINRKGKRKVMSELNLLFPLQQNQSKIHPQFSQKALS